MSVLTTSFKVNSPLVHYEENSITSEYIYRNTEAKIMNDGSVIINPKETKYMFKTNTKVPKMG